MVIAASGAVALGIAERLWFVFHRPVNSDEAIVGLMAQQIVHGRFSAFYWGQHYGGGEAYLVAILFRIFGSSTWALEAVPMALSGVAALLAWRICRHLAADKAIAVLAGALVWAGSETVVSNSTIELGFRGVTLVCGLTLLLLALRVLDSGNSLLTALGIGLAAGLGWWSSPEIVYYAVPAALLLGGAFLGDHQPRRLSRWLQFALVELLAAGAGALPWLWDNVGSGFKSLRVRAFALPPHPLGYGDRLRIFFENSFPILVDLRKANSGRWLWQPAVADLLLAVFIALIAAALLICAIRGGRHLALAIGALAAPALLAASPATWYWRDGRYADLLFPLWVLVIAAGADLAGRRRSSQERLVRSSAAILVFAAVTSALVAFSAVNFSEVSLGKSSYQAAWRDPDAPAEHDAAALVGAGVRAGFADYWVAYDLDFLSGGRLELTTAGTDLDRWTGLNSTVLRSARPAWIFVRPTHASLAAFARTRLVRGPSGVSPATFLAALGRLHVGYREFRTAALLAVTPREKVLPAEVGLR